MKDNCNLGNIKKSPVLKHKSPKISGELDCYSPKFPHLSNNLYKNTKISLQKVTIFDQFSTENIEIDGSVTSRYQPVNNVENQLGLKKFKKVQINKVDNNFQNMGNEINQQKLKKKKKLQKFECKQNNVKCKK